MGESIFESVNKPREFVEPLVELFKVVSGLEEPDQFEFYGNSYFIEGYYKALGKAEIIGDYIYLGEWDEKDDPEKYKFISIIVQSNQNLDHTKLLMDDSLWSSFDLSHLETLKTDTFISKSMLMKLGHLKKISMNRKQQLCKT